MKAAYSAAYGIASAASKIFLARGAGVGSVGVISTHVDQSKFDENLGVNITAIIAGDKKNDFSCHSPLSERAHADAQKHVDSIYNDFCRTVAWNRGISVETVKGTQAGIFHEQDAVNIGFVDEVISFEKAVQKIFSPGTANKSTSASSSKTVPKAAGISTPTANTSVNSEIDNPVTRAFDAIAAKREAGGNTPTTTVESENPVTQAFNSLAANAKRRAEVHGSGDEILRKEQSKREKGLRLAAAMADHAPSYLH